MSLPIESQPDPANYLLFQIRNEKDQPVGHIIATEHFIDSKALELNESLKKVISASSRVFMEELGNRGDKGLAKTTITDLIIRDFAGVYLPEGWTEEQVNDKLKGYKEALKEALSEKFSKIDNAFKNYSPQQQVVFYAAVATVAGFIKLDIDKLYDDHLIAKLLEQGKNPEHFESKEVREKREAETKEMLKTDLLASLNKEKIQINDTNDLQEMQAWKKGDIEALKEIYGKLAPQEAHGFIASQDIRNRNMASRIKEFATADSNGLLPLFVVGTGHLLDINTNITSLLEQHKIYQVIQGEITGGALVIPKPNTK